MLDRLSVLVLLFSAAAPHAEADAGPQAVSLGGEGSVVSVPAFGPPCGSLSPGIRPLFKLSMYAVGRANLTALSLLREFHYLRPLRRCLYCSD